MDAARSARLALSWRRAARPGHLALGCWAKPVTAELPQTQPGEAFSLPVEIGVTDADGKSRVERVELAGRSGRFTFAAAQEPAGLALDPNVRLLVDGRLVRRQ